MNDAFIKLSKDDCYCGITEFYDKVAEKLGYDTQKSRYNCTKISVTKGVWNQIFDYYSSEVHATVEAIGQAWVMYGPKADLKGDGYEACVQDGFFERRDDHELV